MAPWRALPYGDYDKSITIVGPGDLVLVLDNDDVNPEDVEEGLPRIVQALNDAWMDDRRLPRPGESWQSKDSRDKGLTVYVEKVENGKVTYKRFNRRTITVEGFLKLYRPYATEVR